MSRSDDTSRIQVELRVRPWGNGHHPLGPESRGRLGDHAPLACLEVADPVPSLRRVRESPSREVTSIGVNGPGVDPQVIPVRGLESHQPAVHAGGRGQPQLQAVHPAGDGDGVEHSRSVARSLGAEIVDAAESSR